VNLPDQYHPSVHPWHYSPFRALASLNRCLHSSLFSALLVHPRVPNTCNAFFCTASFYPTLGLSTGLVLWNFPFGTFFGILPSSILIIWPAHPNLLILISSTIFRPLYNLYSSLFHLGRQCPCSCVGSYIVSVAIFSFQMSLTFVLSFVLGYQTNTAGDFTTYKHNLVIILSWLHQEFYHFL
jgi:hypothetical protein